MNVYLHVRLHTLPLLLIAPLTLAQTTEADWLEPIEGHTGAVIGAEIRNIENANTQGRKAVAVAIPTAAVLTPDDIEEVIVIANKPAPSEPLLDVDYQWVRDYDRDYFGLLIHPGENAPWPIRLYMSSGVDRQPYNREAIRPVWKSAL